MIKALMFMPLLLGGVSAPALVNETPCVEVCESVNAQMPTKKNASYNDESYEITLTTEEVNGYVYNNLATSFNSNNNYDFGMDYLTEEYFYDDSSDGCHWYVYNDKAIIFLYDNTVSDEVFGSFTANKFYYISDRSSPAYNENISPFTGSLVINLDISSYNDIKEAIEADIDANSGMPTIQDIFTTVTQAVTSFVGSLGQAFNSVTALFYANGAWTFLGILILIAVGVGLIYLAYRVIKGLLHRV